MPTPYYAPRCFSQLPLAVRLPPELLSIIFQITFVHQRKVAEAFERLEKIWEVLDVIHYSHVCQYWRHVALSTPALWSHCDIYHKGFSEFCRRSKSCPLHISAFSPTYRTASEILPDAVSAALECLLSDEAYRVKSLAIIGCLSLAKKFIAFAPHLPTLTWLRIWMDNLPELIVPNLLPVVPNVRRLELSGIILDLESFTNLTHLTLFTIYPNTELFPIACQIIELIGRSPELQRLNLQGIDCTVPTNTMRSVQLDNLERLNLEYINVSLLRFIISHLSIPSTAPLICSSRDNFRPDIWINFADKTISSTTSQLSISMDYDDSTPAIMSILPSSIDLCLITSVYIICLDEEETNLPSVRDWITLFMALPSIHFLQLETPEGLLCDILQALSFDSQSGKCPCPDLERLRILDAQDYESIPTPESVLECLQSRSRKGLTLLTLEMTHESWELRQIRRLVGNLVHS